MTQSTELAASVSATDLSTISKLIRMRLAPSAAEEVRVARMRRLALLASELTSTLRTWSRDALVHCQGTAGATDMDAATEAVVEALREFSEEVTAAACEFGHLPPLAEGDRS